MRTPMRGSVGVAPDAIVGRRRELEALRAWLDAARGGAGRLILCAGEPGIGKSRLAREFARCGFGLRQLCRLGTLRTGRRCACVLAVAPGAPFAWS
ncbi:MAG: AAA family ATPase [Pseudonocardiales bacterium]|nr:AAA family ATPase [Pseudonocardiales bacterium]MBV9651874.1 AAA family ATPase [Pseudonocardiales bacterium]